jgi:hypothetical protein
MWRWAAVYAILERLERSYHGPWNVSYGCGELFSIVQSRDGGTGRRSGLKIRRGQPRGGSTPPPGTKIIKDL